MLYPLSYEGKYGFSPTFDVFSGAQHNLSTTIPENFSTSPSHHPLFNHVGERQRPVPARWPPVSFANRFSATSERWDEVTRQPIKVTVSMPVEYPDRKLPYVVRWRVNGRGRWRSFSTKKGRNGADSFYSQLQVAALGGHDWHLETGLPASMGPTEDIAVAQYCRTFIHDEWRRLSPSTRKSYVEALTSFVVNCARPGATTPPLEWRAHIAHWLTPTIKERGTESGVQASEANTLPRPIQNWLKKNSPSLNELDRQILFDADRRMRKRLDGVTMYSPNMQRRLIAVAKTALASAVNRGLLESVAWPRRDRGAAAKSDVGASYDLDEGEVPSMAQLIEILEAIRSHQPASDLYRILSAVCGFAGLRPGEAVALEVEDLALPFEGWGSIRIERAWSGVPGGIWNVASESIAGPKTQRSRRLVPIPPLLVTELMAWLRHEGIESGPLFLTRNGTRPTQSNWGRALRRACDEVSWPHPLTPYGLRRTNASHLAQSIPIAEAAARLGHSVEVLTRHYVKRVAGQTAISNQILDHLYDGVAQSSESSSNH